MAKKLYTKGSTIKTVQQLIEWDKYGDVYFYWKNKLMHYGFLSSMQFRTVIKAVEDGILLEAIKI